MSQKQPFLGVVVGAALPTILAGAIEGAVRGALQKNSPPNGATDVAIAKDVVKRLEQNPAVVNQVNAEAPYQSRVVVGNATGLIGALGIIIPAVAAYFGYDIAAADVVQVLGAIATLWGVGYALYGRLKGGLKPLFSR